MTTVDMTDGSGGQQSQPANRGMGQNTFFALYLLTCTVFGLFHLLLGANYLIVLTAVVSVVVATVPAIRFGWRDMPSLFCFLFGVRYAASAIIWKVYELSPLDQGLYSAQTSFNVVLVGLSACSLAAFLSHVIWPARPLLTERLNAYGFALLLLAGAALMAAGIILGIAGTELLGGVKALIGDGLVILPMAYMAYNIQTSRIVMSPGLIAVLLLWGLLALSNNSRLGGLTMLLSIFSMYLCFNFKIGPRVLAIGAVVVTFFVLVISPAMVDVRGYRANATPLEMMNYTIEAAQKRLMGEGPTVEPIDPTYTRYRLNYVQVDSSFAGRAISVQQLDFLVALVESNGAIGTDRFWSSLVELLPSALIEDKSTVNHPGYALTVYGVLEAGAESRIEVTPFGSAFSYGRFEFLFPWALAGFGMVFLLFRLFCPRFENSVFAAFVLVAYMNPLSGGDVTAPFNVLRTFPFEVALFWLANVVSGSAAAKARQT